MLAALILFLGMGKADAKIAEDDKAKGETSAKALKSSGDGLLWEPKNQNLRIHFVGSKQTGYDIFFEYRTSRGWQKAAGFPAQQVWSVYSDWRSSWYAEPHHIKAQEVEAISDGRVRASAEADVAGQRWWFADVYSIEHGMIRIDRSFAHSGGGSQSRITLESRVRLPLGKEQRMLIPGVLYNNNPSSTLIGTKISIEPGGVGLYEEHRLPIPMVNVESEVGGRRVYGSIVTKPSKLLEGNKGNDHWWSMGLEYGDGYVDLLSVSGPVATNGKKSQIYGHRHGFDSYDDTYLDVKGPVVFEKTLYVDIGSGVKTGYAFRETLWKAFDVFEPVETPHVPFYEAMTLVSEYAKSRFYSAPRWKSDRAAAVVRFGKEQIADGDALVISRLDNKKDTYMFYATGTNDPYSSTADANNKITGIEICEPDAWFTKTVDRVIAAINNNPDSAVTADSPKFLAPDKESWGMRIAAKTAGTDGLKIGMEEKGGKIEFTSNLLGPWGLMGKEPKTTHLVLIDEAPQLAVQPAGYEFFAGDGHLMYGWCGGNLGIAYGLLDYAERTGDEIARKQAINTVEFFVHGAKANVEGLYYGDYYAGGSWAPAYFDSSAPGISSRQYGENLEHLASVIELGRKCKLPEAEEWFAVFKKGGDFLLSSPRHKGLFPRAWNADGTALGWPEKGDPTMATISAAGAPCISVLARLSVMTGESKYRKASVEAMDAYWRAFGETLSTPPWGATIDAGAEDKEAGSGIMRAATEVYLATKDHHYLEMARDAADWTLTWMFFHNIALKPESGLLHEHLHTIGWTFISTQNQEIDVWAYFMAPDYCRLGLLAGDERYKKIGKVMFDAASQTISRPGAMFGPVPGVQAEHYNHSNCTYVGGQPDTWRGSQHSMGICWTFAAALYGGTRLSALAPEQFYLGPGMILK